MTPYGKPNPIYQNPQPNSEGNPKMSEWKTLKELWDENGQCDVFDQDDTQYHLFGIYNPGLGKDHMGILMNKKHDRPEKANAGYYNWRLLPKTRKVTLYRYTFENKNHQRIYQGDWSNYQRKYHELGDPIIKTETKEIEVDE